MDLFRPGCSPPLLLETRDLCVFPTDDAHYLSDYAAVMRTREGLRVWSQSPWPEDDFTPEQNRADLRLHVEDNEQHAAYGYMIYDPARVTCYGSAYVNPLAPVLENYVTTPEEAALISQHPARVDFWTVADPGVEERVAAALAGWLRDTWRIRPLFGAREGMTRRQAIYEDLGFARLVSLKSPEGTSLILYQPPD